MTKLDDSMSFTMLYPEEEGWRWVSVSGRVELPWDRDWETHRII